MTDTLTTAKRTELGSLNVRRLRREGYVPAVVYGRGEESTPIKIPEREILSLIAHGGHIFKLTGDLKDDVMIKDVQWNAFGTEVLHLDFLRIRADEVVELEIQIELVGEAPGTHSGGVVRQFLHEVEIQCPANAVPDRLELSINELELGQALTAADIPLPEGAKLVTDPDTTVVTCEEPTEMPEEEAEGELGAAAEPEVIGKPDSEEAGDEG